MPILPGVPLLPTVAANFVLSLIPDKPITVVSPDSVCIFSPMHDEEAGARRALVSILEQTRKADAVVVSVNGGTDDNYEVVAAALATKGFQGTGKHRLDVLGASMERWQSDRSPTVVHVISYDTHTGKAASINNALHLGLITTQRVVLVDGDTVFDPHFLAALADRTYELRFEDTESGRLATLHENSVLSGGVMSYVYDDASLMQKLISAGREAEYAFSYVLRKGQTKTLGSNGLTGRSRLFTLIGCGFSTRRDLLPMPQDTRTEDHDFTQVVQNDRKSTRTKVTRDDLSKRGFRFVVDGEERTPEEVFDRHDRIELVRRGQAQFVGPAVMKTEDPATFDALVRQLDRWHGGGQENFLKRLGTHLRPNVAFTLWSGVLENIIVLGLLLVILGGGLLNYGNPSIGLPYQAIWIWAVLDVVSVSLLTMYGFLLYHRATGASLHSAIGRSATSTLRTLVPWTLLRYLNAIMYLVSAVQVVPAYVRQRLAVRGSRGTDTLWGGSEGARAPKAKRILFGGAIGMVFAGIMAVNAATWISPIHLEGWSLVNETRNPVHIEQHLHTPVRSSRPSEMAGVRPVAPGNGATDAPGASETLGAQGGWPDPMADGSSAGVEGAGPAQATVGASAYCAPSLTPGISDDPRVFSGDSAAYLPLGPGELLTLARLVPLIGFVEAASTTYAIPPAFFVQVLTQESYLDPLALGPTDDRGLSQMTSDALTLVREISTDPDSRFYNPALMVPGFSVFDPDFSSCAGAAKLAWAIHQVGPEHLGKAYALFINPVHGVVRGNISEIHRPLVASLDTLEPLISKMANAFAMFDEAPDRLTEPERALLELAGLVRTETISAREAYVRTYALVREYDIGDDDLYATVLTRLYDSTSTERSQP